MTQNSDNEQIVQRREKLAALREQRNAYPNDFRPHDLALPMHTQYGHLSAHDLEQQAVNVSVAGRMMSRRIMGKASFCHLQDRSGRIQLFIQRNELAEGLYGDFKKWDIGDILGAAISKAHEERGSEAGEEADDSAAAATGGDDAAGAQDVEAEAPEAADEAADGEEGEAVDAAPEETKGED